MARNPIAAYGFALAAMIAAVGVRLLLQPLLGDRLPFITLFLAVAAVAWYGGRGPALLTFVTGAAAVAFFILEPRYSFAVGQIEYRVGFLLYAIVCLGSIAMFEALHKARRQAENEVVARRAADRVLAERETLLRVTLASIGDAVLTTDANGDVTYLNAVAQELICGFINSLAREPLSQNPRVVYWSYCQKSQKVLPSLACAASTFGEHVDRRSEPDVILEDDNVLVFIECKLGAGNRTRPSDPENPKLYSSGGNSWFGTIFHPYATFTKIAVEEGLYELMRLWLLGSWIAAQTGKRFLLVNIVREGARIETGIEARFNALTQPNPHRAFVRCTWERIYSEFVLPRVGSPNADQVALYLKEKTLGYAAASQGMQSKLRRAFRNER